MACLRSQVRSLYPPPTFAKATVGKANSRCAKVSAKALAKAENYEYRIQTFVSKTQQTMSKTILFASAENMYVYILKSINNPKKKYVGITKNPTQRLQQHNNGESKYTSQYCPWKFQTIIWLEDNKKSYQLEKYFKSGSGRAFSKKYL